MNVYIWGTGNLAEKCLVDLVPDVNVMGFVESKPKKEFFAGRKVISGKELLNQTYDYLIIANSFADEILKDYELDENKIVHYQMTVHEDISGKIELKRKNAVNLRDSFFLSQRKLDITEKARSIMPYISLQKDDLKFIFNKNDNLIANDILGNDVIYGKDEMLFFYEHAPKRENGYFVEIGANVGTTTVYFRKKIAKGLKYIAFEPLKENYKCLKTNCIINECEDIIVENVGLSNVNGQKKMFVFDGAFGSSMVKDDKTATETCEFKTLDSYIQDKELNPKDIMYIWADVQCHEIEVIEGALDTLKESPASLFIEYNIDYHKQNEGRIEHFVDMISQIYKTFICYEQYEAGMNKVRDISELIKVSDELDCSFCNILLMK